MTLDDIAKMNLENSKKGDMSAGEHKGDRLGKTASSIAELVPKPMNPIPCMQHAVTESKGKDVHYIFPSHESEGRDVRYIFPSHSLDIKRDQNFINHEQPVLVSSLQ